MGPFDGSNALDGRLSGTPGSHLALIYHGVDEFVARVGGYVRAGLALEEPVLVLASREKVQRVRDELGAEAAAVEFADAEVGYHP